MTTIDELTYTAVELASFLPAGWHLEADAPVGWEATHGCFRCTVHDISKLPWALEVRAEAAAREGRIPALKAAISHLERQRFASFF